MEKFPDHIESAITPSDYHLPSPIKPNGLFNGATSSQERWLPRREGGSQFLGGRAAAGGRSHGRQKSLSDAIRTIRTRKASVSANAQEIAEALKAPVSPKLVVRVLDPFNIILLIRIDFMYCLVFLFCFDEHFLEVNINRIPETCHPHSYTIRIRYIILPLLFMAGHYFP